MTAEEMRTPYFPQRKTLETEKNTGEKLRHEFAWNIEKHLKSGPAEATAEEMCTLYSNDKKKNRKNNNKLEQQQSFKWKR